MLNFLALIAVMPAYSGDCPQIVCAFHDETTCAAGDTSCVLVHDQSEETICGIWDHAAGSINVQQGSVSLDVMVPTVLSSIEVEEGALLRLFSSNGSPILVRPTGGSDGPGVLIHGTGSVLLEDVSIQRVDADPSLGHDFYGSAARLEDDGSLCMVGGSVSGSIAEQGSIWGGAGSSIGLTNIIFFNNRFHPQDANDPQGADIWSQGALELTNTTHTATPVPTDRPREGGSVYFEGTTLKITGSTFTGYEAEDGGAIVINDADSTDLTDVSITAGAATTGGAISVHGAGAVTLLRGSYTANDAEDGGALFVDDPGGGSVQVFGAHFQENTATSRGGAIYVEDQVLIVGDATFYGTTAADGGAIASVESTSTIQGSAFCSPTATDSGGAIFGEGGLVTVTNSLFVQATAPTGSIASTSSFSAISNITALDVQTAPFDGAADVVDSVIQDGGWGSAFALGGVTFDGVVSDTPVLSLLAPHVDVVSSFPFLPALRIPVEELPCGVEFRLNPVQIGIDPWTSNPTRPDQHSGVFGANSNTLLSVGATGTGFDWYNNADGDPYPLAVDCDDQNVNIHPGALEYCGTDYNCDGNPNDVNDEDADFGIDTDGDGYIRLGSGACSPGPGLTTSSGPDCDDNNTLAWTATAEVCDGVDNDCDGSIDEGFVVKTFYPDDDGDGYGDEDWPETSCDTALYGYIPAQYNPGHDCDDGDNTANPGEPEICDSTDHDCDGDETTNEDGTPPLGIQQGWTDDDMDGFGATEEWACDLTQAGLAEQNGDCNDTDSTINPNAPESCDPTEDRDCNGDSSNIDYGPLPADAVLRWNDDDEDGFGAGEEIWTCNPERDGFSETNDDCDDTEQQVNPGALEVCNGRDDDCNDEIDDIDTTQETEGALRLWNDGDEDGYGSGVPYWRCGGELPPLTAEEPGDCDDTAPTVHPGAEEQCNGIDDDCNNKIDDITGDADVCDPSTEPNVEMWVAGGCGCQSAPDLTHATMLALPSIIRRRSRR